MAKEEGWKDVEIREGEDEDDDLLEQEPLISYQNNNNALDVLMETDLLK